jgi:hypothetical protein
MEKFSDILLGSSKDKIRLLQILPRYQKPRIKPGLFSSLEIMKDYLFPSLSARTFSCTLKETSLKDHPEYFALSYAQGNSTPSERIYIDDMNFPITGDLKTALQHLQHETQVVNIWIDALCKNSDEKAKAEHVMKMKDIYQEATHVMVWLGPAEDCSDELMACLERIGRSCEDLELTRITPEILFDLSKRPDEPYSRDVTAKLEQLYGKFDYLLPTVFPFEAYRAFLGREWWRSGGRQHLGVARGVTFTCGEKRISLDYLNNAHTFLLGYSLSALEGTADLENAVEANLRWVVEALLEKASTG